jgi:hypothetical protein
MATFLGMNSSEPELRPQIVDAANRILTYLALNEDVLANHERAIFEAAGLSIEELNRAKRLVTQWSSENSRLDVLEQRVRDYFECDGLAKGYVEPGTAWSLEQLRRVEADFYRGHRPARDDPAG